MKFAKRVFLLAGIYGLLVMAPQYFLEGKIGRDYPPPITHPENFYGFIGVTLAWQLMFLLISRDPERYRLAMLPAIVEKFTFWPAVIVLYLQHRVAGSVLGFGIVDLVLGLLFIESFRRTAPARS